jgi:mannose-1-phosphate guanylyltransferase
LTGLLPVDEYGNSAVGTNLAIDTQRTLVFGEKRLIATIGVRDLVIVDTDDALLVCTKADEQRVKEVVEWLKHNGRTDLT